MEFLLWKCLLCVACFCVVYSKLIEIRVANKLERCFNERRFDTNMTDPRYDNIHGYCIQKYRWHLNRQIHENITLETSNWIDELLRKSTEEARKPRHIRQSLNVRKEYRRLTDKERNDYHRAINMLKKDTVSFN